MENGQLKSSLADLFLAAGIDSGGMEINPIYGGGNNRVVSIQTTDGKYLAKTYYSHPTDTRNRLASEYSFLSYALNIGLDCIPKPVFCDKQNNIGLYEFIEGRKLDSSDLTSQHISEAATFIKGLNAGVDRDPTLPTASEGGFSVEQHFSIIDFRLRRLRDIPSDTNSDRQALSFVREIESSWKKTKDDVSARCESISKDLGVDDRCISPSDFGFHNALLKKSGKVCFLDFEYAGWDDPAKMVDDFFLQPAVSVSFNYFEDFVSVALDYSKNKTKLGERAHLLFPVFKIKWCCLMLNEFFPDAAKRRRVFSSTTGTEKG
ncbi:MAG: phosphotransferase [Nitrospinae bacterium]|nr:phosphotransferase [Nitrospinota bacterium]